MEMPKQGRLSLDAARVLRTLAFAGRSAAIDLAEHHLAESPQNADLLLTLGILHREENDLDLAIDYWTKALDLDPSSIDIRFHLLCGLHARGLQGTSLERQLRDSLYCDADNFTFSGTGEDVGPVYECLERHGLALIRKCLPPPVIEQWRQNVETNIDYLANSDEYRDIRASDGVWPVYVVASQSDFGIFKKKFTGAMRGNIDDTRYATEDNQNWTSRLLLGHLEGTALKEAIWYFLGKREPEVRLDYSMARYLRSPGHDSPGDAHQDGRLQRRQDRFATFWIPFVAAGAGAAPSLAAVPLGLNSYFPVNDLLKIAPNAIPEELWFAPRFEPGDLLLHSTFTIHKTFLTADMTGTRASVDIRLF